MNNHHDVLEVGPASEGPGVGVHVAVVVCCI